MPCCAGPSWRPRWSAPQAAERGSPGWGREVPPAGEWPGRPHRTEGETTVFTPLFPVSDQPFASLNASLLARYRASADPRDRNRIVELNLPLVRQVAERQSRTTSLPFEDLVQLGCLGLIRAIERFDPHQAQALSSYAVPYIRGAMQHHLRDHHQPLRCSRQLRELHCRGQRLQQQSPALSEAELAAALGCRVDRWREACALHRALRIRSLDAPAAAADGDGGSLPLLAQIEASQPPHPCRPDSSVESPCCDAEPQDWLRRRLGRLDPAHRRLLEGRVLEGASWRELGELVGLRARAAQKRCETLLVQLRQEIGVELGELFTPPLRLEAGALQLRAAAGPGRSPAARRSGSAAH
ncbi:MAG: hypothetical protein DCF24_09670 [Cyanobium sp.]|nr:MAG: hypothetical protein DCF24_09670 [Cyanobium sp.]